MVARLFDSLFQQANDESVQSVGCDSDELEVRRSPQQMFERLNRRRSLRVAVLNFRQVAFNAMQMDDNAIGGATNYVRPLL